jgi:branched-chain amino acid transport system permease protein
MKLAQHWTGAQILNYPLDIFPVEIFRVAGLIFTLQDFVIVGCVIVLAAALILCLFHTSLGSRIRAVAVNERTARLLGVNPQSVYLVTFFTAGALAGAAGVILGVAYNSVSYQMGEPMLLRAFVIIVLGGLGSMPGALIAGLLLGIVDALTTAYVSSQLSDTVMFMLLFVTLLLRPTGFFPGLHREARKA